MNAKAAAGARAAEERAAREAKEAAARKAPAAGVGMAYQPPTVSPEPPEAPEVAAVFGTLLEGWRSEAGGEG